MQWIFNDLNLSDIDLSRTNAPFLVAGRQIINGASALVGDNALLLKRMANKLASCEMFSAACVKRDTVEKRLKG